MLSNSLSMLSELLQNLQQLNYTALFSVVAKFATTELFVAISPNN